MFSKKILVLGNETEDTNIRVQKLADDVGTINHGLILSSDYQPISAGYYHTSVADLLESDILDMASSFDQIIMLDQGKNDYPHFKSFVSTFRLMIELERLGFDTKFRDNPNNQTISYWYDLLRKHKSICFYPFMVLKDNHENTSLCCKNEDPIKPVTDIKNWKTDPDYTAIRHAMLQEEALPQCRDCRSREEEGLESARQFESLETAVRFDFSSIDDLTKIENPVYYELRPSNKCNIMCRMCDNAHSHLIEKEWKEINIPLIPWKFKNTNFDVINFDSVKRIYVAGGEPTVLQEFYDFLRKCIANGTTDFELLIGTNGMKLSKTLLDLLNHFSDVCFSVSLDGYKAINDYIRWGSKFDTVVNNTHLMLSEGHKVGFQIVFSMYNTCRIHEIYEFLSAEFPKSTTLSQPAGSDPNAMGVDVMLPYNFPDPGPVLESMYRCQKTSLYHGNGRSSKSIVDAMIDTYSNDHKIDLGKLRKFFEFNDRLDKSRGSDLRDYIPELAVVRDRIFQS